MTAKMIIWLMAVVALTFAIIVLRKELSIDRCLDRGGSWDYSNSTCQ
jgi:hypothetical protein